MVIFALLGLAILGAAALALLLHLVVSVINSYTSALSVPTPTAIIPDVMTALDLPEVGTYVEPGCGDGRVLAAVAIKRPKLKATGIDNDPVTLAIARTRLRGKAKLVQGSLMNFDFSTATRVFTYLSPKMMAMLEPKLESELPHGGRLVSLQFPLPGRKPDQEIAIKSGKPHASTLYVYDY